MDHYLIWFNLKPGVDDLEICRALDDYLNYLREHGQLLEWNLTRRKFGFSPTGMPEFHVRLSFRDLAQLDAAFHHTATRSGEVERRHAEVFSRVRDFQSALYRDFPDDVRIDATTGREVV